MTAIIVFLLFPRHDKTQLRGKVTTRKTHKTKMLLPGHKMYEKDVKDELATVLLTVHSKGTHVQTTNQSATQATVKVEQVWRPTISSARSSKEWSYFLTRWKDYAKATKLKGNDMVIQFLECCQELQKDLTRNAGSSLTNKSVDEVMAAIKKTCHERRKHYGCLCTTSQHASRPG